MCDLCTKKNTTARSYVTSYAIIREINTIQGAAKKRKLQKKSYGILFGAPCRVQVFTNESINQSINYEF